MRFYPVILALGLLTASGCSHLNRGSDSAADSGLVVEPMASTGTPNTAHSDAQKDTPKSPSEVASTQPKHLLQRIREGFEFPPLESKYTAEYERWDANHPTYLRNLFARAEPFLFHIVEEIEKRGLPMELALLPAIESAYKPNAKSRSRASGLWQFVPATGREYGLHEDWWYDSRRDVLASTDAALTYLSKLNKQFDGDWFLTLAAYNAGPGTLTRAIRANARKKRGVDYQSLQLRSETRRYVPKLIALKRILLNPEKYKVELPTLENQEKFAVLPLPGQIDLLAFAEAMKIDFNRLMHLNAGNKRWATSPSGPNRILIPLSNNETDNTRLIGSANEYIAQAPKLQFRDHRIDNGESLSTIAARYGVSVSALQSTNNLIGSRIRAGQTLLIPLHKEAADAVQSSYLKSAVVETSATDSAAANSIASASLNDVAAQKRVVHRVKQGDTLWSIARSYQVQLQQLLAWNNLSSDQILKLDQALFVFRP